MVEPSAACASRPAPDLGRVVVVALFTLSLLSAVGRGWTSGWTAASSGGSAARAALEVACSLATALFCALVVVAYLRRGEAVATDRSLRVRLAAPLATCLPLMVPLLPVRPPGSGRALLALGLVLAGTAWCVWAVRHLSRCLSVVPQARHLVDSGPYRWVRHPLYLGEVVATTGAAVSGGRWTHAVVVLALLGLQLYRARREEALLTGAVPGYAGYAARTWRIVPGVV